MRTLSKIEYEELLRQSEIIEQDGYGVKVIRMPDGNFLKTFWLRRVFTSRRIFPEWLRFKQNAAGLHRRKIPTVTVLETLRIPHLNRTAVIYIPLEGQTIRQLAAAGGISGGLIFRLGKFIAELHRQGIYFRSLHFGNVLLCPDGNFGLIDISNMKTIPWALGFTARRRNFVNLFRYSQDLEVLHRTGIQNFIDGYLNGAGKRFSGSVNSALTEFKPSGKFQAG